MILPIVQPPQEIRYPQTSPDVFVRHLAKVAERPIVYQFDPSRKVVNGFLGPSPDTPRFRALLRTRSGLDYSATPSIAVVHELVLAPVFGSLTGESAPGIPYVLDKETEERLVKLGTEKNRYLTLGQMSSYGKYEGVVVSWALARCPVAFTAGAYGKPGFLAAAAKAVGGELEKDGRTISVSPSNLRLRAPGQVAADLKAWSSNPRSIFAPTAPQRAKAKLEIFKAMTDREIKAAYVDKSGRGVMLSRNGGRDPRFRRAVMEYLKSLQDVAASDHPLAKDINKWMLDGIIPEGNHGVAWAPPFGSMIFYRKQVGSIVL